MVKQKLELVRNWQEEKELLVLGFFEKDGEVSGTELGQRIFNNLTLGSANLRKDFQGKFGQKSLIYKVSPKRILFVGLGKAKDFNPEARREISSQVACYVRNLGIKSYSVEVFGDFSDLLCPSAVKTQVESQAAGLYRFESYKKSDKNIEEIKILVSFVTPEIEKAFCEGEIVAKNLYFVRDLINEPASKMTPAMLAETAKEVAQQSGRKIQVKILDNWELKEMGANLIAAVGRAGFHPPYLITLEYKPENHQNAKPYVLVGKGICFDSGGLDIKTESSMAGMHTDMAGGAAAIGALKTIAELDLPLWIVGLVPTAENLIAEGSYKPGDIIKAYNGKTIEIGNTDAEGRLILFDAMAYAKEKFNPYLMIDIATLTGACKVALGEHYAGLLGSDRKFLKKIKEAGEESGDKVWELPLDKKYAEEIGSEVADLKNIGSHWAGAITAACFLQEAIGKEQPWLHLDIAGAGRMEIIGQATGFGLRLFVQFFLNEIK